MTGEITFNVNQLAEPVAGEAEGAFQMDEASFRAFYQSTARPLWSYLSRVMGDPAAADDLLQETYYRFLRARLPQMEESRRKNYLYRIATNLMRDEWRRRKTQPLLVAESSEAAENVVATMDEYAPDKARMRAEVSGALARMKPRDKELLWLAYVEEASHREIADIKGIRETSVRIQLFRARQRLAGFLRRRGVGAGGGS